MNEINLTLHYPTANIDETLRGRLLDGKSTTVELTTHAGFLPLAPGDLVSIDDAGRIVDIVQLHKTHTYEVHLKTGLEPGEMPTVAQLEDIEAWFQEVFRHTWITKQSTFTFMVSGDREWLDRVVDDERVEHFEVNRTPTLQLDLAVAVQHPDLDGLGAGPWT